ncbi:MAG: GNAT family N-acetyltransferase [Planctomycetota bacterium]
MIDALDPDLHRVTELSAEAMAPLMQEAKRDGHGFVERLLREWDSGANRFDAPGEALFAKMQGASIVGIGGLNIDPYANDPTTGRVRHLYVRSSQRRCGVGRQLLGCIFRAATGSFARLHLRTSSPAAAEFYVRCGFAPVSGTPNVTHTIAVANSIPGPLATADESSR